MQEGKEAGIMEWISMLFSILVMLFLTLRGRKAINVEETEEIEPQGTKRAGRAPHEEELFDDEEPEKIPIKVAASSTPKYAPLKVKPVVISKSVHLQAYAKREAERALNASYRLKNALEGFQQRRPLDQKDRPNAIETRTFDTMRVSEFLRVDADADAREAARVKKQVQFDEGYVRLRNGLIWSQILQPPIALCKGSHLP